MKSKIPLLFREGVWEEGGIFPLNLYKYILIFIITFIYKYIIICDIVILQYIVIYF